MIEAIVAAIVASLIKEAPDAFVALLRKLGVLPDDLSDNDVIERVRAADILGDVNPMRQIDRKRRDPIVPPARIVSRPVEVVEWPEEYDKPESD